MIHKSQDTGPFATGQQEFTFTVRSAFVDRFLGVTTAEPIWAEKTNVAYVARHMANREVSVAVANYFTARGLAKTLVKVIPERNTRDKGVKFRVSDLRAAIESDVNNSLATGVILEMILPTFINLGWVYVATTVVDRFTYQSKMTVGVDAILEDITKQEIISTIEQCRQLAKVPTGQHAVASIAEMLAEAFFPIGNAIRSSSDYARVISDIVIGVRAILDPNMTGMTGDVPVELREHDVVKALSTNLTFISAALSLTGPVKISCSEVKFDNWAPMVMTMMKTSERYSLVSKTEILKTLNIEHISDVMGIRRASVVSENISMDPVALTVVPVPDLSDSSCLTLAAPAEPLSEFMAATYGRLPARLAVSESARVLADSIRSKLELDHSNDDASGDTGQHRVYMHTVRHMPILELALLLSDKVMFNNINRGQDNDGASSVTFVKTTNRKFKGSPEIVSGAEVFWPSLIYSVKGIDVSKLRLTSGVFSAGYGLTTDPVEVILMTPETASTSASEVRAQLLPRVAINAKIIESTIKDALVKIPARVGFQFDILGMKFQGAVASLDLMTLRNSMATHSVLPMYNKAILIQSFDALHEAMEIARAREDETIRLYSCRLFAMKVLEIARGLPAVFVNDIYRVVTLSSTAGLNYRDSVLQSATTRQASIVAFVYLFALKYFLILHGYITLEKDDSHASKVIEYVMNDPECVRAWAEVGAVLAD